MTRFQIHRLIWIDAWLERSPDLGLNRHHLEFGFDLSTPQVSKDLALFQTLFPGRVTYNASAKAYFATPGSPPAFQPWMHEAVFSAGCAAAEAAEALP
jgi:hypothetical protein